MQTVIGDVLVNYEILGADNLPPLVILHGWGSNLDEWRSIGTAFSKKFRIVLLDLPGFGGSTVPHGKTFDIYDYTDFVSKFLMTKKIKQPILLGHSFGGRIGIIMGAKRGVLKKLILVDSAGIETKGLRTAIVTYLFKKFSSILPTYARQYLRNRLGSEDYVRAGPLRETLVKVVNENLRYLLPKVVVPTLVIWGENDINQEIKYARLMRDEMPNARLRIIWGSGHFPHIEKPNDFLAVLKEEVSKP